jgi:CDP-diacylglycerol--serine O-phosphatidyltransferase
MSGKSAITKAIPALGYFNLANALTTVGGALNIVIVFMALQGNTKWAFWLYIFLIGIDAFDGKIAKWLKCTSDFGARLDSLCDAVSFCVMPAVIAFFLGFTSPAAVALAILNAIAGMWRLAYFDIHGLSRSVDREFYVGWPTTRTAALFYIVLTFGGLFRDQLNLLFYGFFILSPILMLANVRIEKFGFVAKFFYIFLPITAVAYLFIWR